MLEMKFKITNPTGLDARNSSNLVSQCGKFTCDVKLYLGNTGVDAKSIMGVMSLNAQKGEIIRIAVNGIDETDALEEISFLIQESKLGKEY